MAARERTNVGQASRRRLACPAERSEALVARKPRLSARLGRRDACPTLPCDIDGGGGCTPAPVRPGLRRAARVLFHRDMKLPRRLFVARLVLLLLALLWCAPALAKDFWVYFGTYTGKSSKGIYASRLDAATGKLTPPELVAETTSPSSLVNTPINPLVV